MKKRYNVSLSERLTVMTSPTFSISPLEIAALAVQDRADYESVTVELVLLYQCGKEISIFGTDSNNPHFVSKLDLFSHMGIRIPDAVEDPTVAPVEYFENRAQANISTKCDQIKTLLLKKNADYGNSALDPVRIFSKADAEEQIRVRIDDKLSRLAGAGEKNFSEDTVMDLVGYLILLMVKMEESDNGKV